ncbi:MAG: hypothetical protein Q4E69_05510 [Bacilli bacterium]|nr:hypothetical protein [Bacilli bacterium]
MRKLARFLIFISFLLIGSGVLLNYQIDVKRAYEEAKKHAPIEAQNSYVRKDDYNFVKNVDNAYPNNYQELLNTIFSIINNGYDEFTFFCGNEYSTCLKDLDTLGKDQETLSTINNYVHPFNTFENVKIHYNDEGKIKLEFDKYYKEEDIVLVNTKVDTLYTSLVNSSFDDKTNIKVIHDYIINNTKYDSKRAHENILDYKSNIAYGTLLEGYAVCGGYSDAMAIFLDRMGIKNFKVASADHVWNALELDGVWYNLDLTWDDPVVSDGSDYLDDSYFLISTDRLLQLDTSQHTFNIENYTELKSS